MRDSKNKAWSRARDSQLIVKRVFTAAGANRQFVNGSPTTLAVLKTLGEALVDLHGRTITSRCLRRRSSSCWMRSPERKRCERNTGKRSGKCSG